MTRTGRAGTRPRVVAALAEGERKPLPPAALRATADWRPRRAGRELERQVRCLERRLTPSNMEWS